MKLYSIRARKAPFLCLIRVAFNFAMSRWDFSCGLVLTFGVGGGRVSVSAFWRLARLILSGLLNADWALLRERLFSFQGVPFGSVEFGLVGDMDGGDFCLLGVDFWWGRW